MPDYTKELAAIKEAWGIVGNQIDIKLERLLTATNGNPTVEAITAVLKNAIGPSQIDFALVRVAADIRDLVATGKSIPKKNRSALA